MCFVFLLIFILVSFVHLNITPRKRARVSLNRQKGVRGIKKVESNILRQKSANFFSKEPDSKYALGLAGHTVSTTVYSPLPVVA